MDVEALVRACTVRVMLQSAGGGAQLAGTGFFVDRGLVLTCSHVIGGRKDTDLLTVHWSGKDWPCQVAAELPAPFPVGAKLAAGLPDLALLSCGATNRDVLLLGSDRSYEAGASFFFFGFSEEADGEVVGHPLSCPLDGELEVDPDWRLLKFDTGRLLKGHSGCAVIEERSGEVAAVAKRRITGAPSACYGVPASTVLQKLPALAAPQRAFRQSVEQQENARRTLPLPLAEPFFYPRPEPMQALATVLQGSPIAAVLGAEGVGKTALVREYVLVSLTRYPEVLWLDASTREAARQGLAAATQRLSLPPAASNLSETGRAIFATLDRVAPGWLLVLDGLAEIALGQELLLAAAPATRMIVTSRLAELAALGARDPVRLDPLDAAAAAALVAARLGGPAPSALTNSVVQAAEGRPGALEQGAAALLDARAKTGAWPGEAPEFAARIDAALAVRPAGSLLRFLAVLADAPLPLGALANRPDDRTPWQAAEALTTTSLGWTDPLGEAITLEARTRDAVLRRMSDAERRDFRGRARADISNTLRIESSGVIAHKFTAALLPHALHLLSAPTSDPPFTPDFVLRTQAAGGLMERGDYVSAEALLAAMLDEVSPSQPPQHGLLATANMLATLAKLRIDMGRPDAAVAVLDILDQILRSYPAVGPGEPADLAQFIMMESSVLRGRSLAAGGKHAQALELFLPALNYFAHHARGSVRVADTLESTLASLMASRNVATATMLLPRLLEALKGTPSALEAEARVRLFLGIGYIETAGNNPISQMVQLGNAERELCRALNLAETALPDPSDVVASCCVNLGLLANRAEDYGRTPDPQAAIGYLKRAIDIRTRLYGGGTPRLASAFYHLGVAQRRSGAAADAEASLRRVLAGQPSDGLAMDALKELIALYTASGNAERQAEAEKRLAALRAANPPGPRRQPIPGETAAARNAAFMAATLALDQMSKLPKPSE